MVVPSSKPPATGHQTDVEEHNSNKCHSTTWKSQWLPNKSQILSITFRALHSLGLASLGILVSCPHEAILWSHHTSLFISLGYVRLFHISVLLNIWFPLPEHCSTPSPVPNSHCLLRPYSDSFPWVKTSPNSLQQSLLPFTTLPEDHVHSPLQPWLHRLSLFVCLSSWDLWDS